MFCFRYKRLLIPYSEGGLDERTRRKVEAHVSKCGCCAEELSVVRSVSSALRRSDVPAMEPAPDLWARVSARIACESAPERSKRIVKAPQAVSAFAAAVLIAAVGFGAIRSELFTGAHEVAQAPRSETIAPDTAADDSRTDTLVLSREAGTVTSEPAAPADPPVVRRAPKTAAPSGNAAKAGQPARERAAAKTDKLAYGAFAAKDSDADHSRGEVIDAKPGAHARTYLWAEEKRPAASAAPGRAGDATAAVSTEMRRSRGVAGADLDLADTMSADLPEDRSVVAAVPPGAPRDLGFTRAAGVHSYAASASDVALAADAVRSGTPPLGALAEGESVVDTLNRTEGIHVAALFAYP